MLFSGATSIKSFSKIYFWKSVGLPQNNFTFLVLKLLKFYTYCSCACMAQWDDKNSFLKHKRGESFICSCCISFPSISIFLIICKGVLTNSHISHQSAIQYRLHRVLNSIFLKQSLLHCPFVCLIRDFRDRTYSHIAFPGMTLFLVYVLTAEGRAGPQNSV